MTEPDLDLTQDEQAGLLSFYDIEAWQKDPDTPPPPLITRTVTGPTEVWLRGAQNMWVALGLNPYPKFVFDTYDLARRPLKMHAALSRVLPQGYRFEYMVVHAHYAEIFDSTNPEEPAERVPVWRHADDPEAMLRLAHRYTERGWSRIVVGMPHARSKRPPLPERKRTLEWLHRVAAAYPHVRLHLTGTNAFTSFGLNFAAIDIAPANQVQLGMIRLPNGTVVSAMNTAKHLKWLHVLGYSASILKTSQVERVGFNMRSMLWAAEHWNDPEGLVPYKVRTRHNPLGLPGLPDTGMGHSSQQLRRTPSAAIQNMFARPPMDADMYPQMSPDPTEAYAYAEPITNAPLVPINPRKKDNGDQIVCNACTLATTCRSFREGSVCSVPGSPGSGLAAMFATRDADVIREALGKVIEAQTERYVRAASKYRADDESDVMDIKRSEHLMKMENSLVRSGEALVKVLDPSFRASNVPAIAGTQIHLYNPRVLVADVLKQLEQAGVARDQIDPAKIIEIAQERGMIEP